MWCWMQGISIARKGIRMLGYSFKVLITRGFRANHKLQMHVDANMLRVTSQEQLVREQAAEREPHKSGFFGVRGSNVLVHMLWYAAFDRLFFIPFVHTFIRGVFHSFMLALTGQKGKAGQVAADNAGQQAAQQGEGLPDGLAPWRFPASFRLSPAQKKEAAARISSMRVTQDFGRGPMSLGTPLKSATMEDLMRGLDVIFPLQLAGVSTCRSVAVHTLLYCALLHHV
jgi:hypothetical protein